MLPPKVNYKLGESSNVLVVAVNNDTAEMLQPSPHATIVAQQIQANFHMNVMDKRLVIHMD